MKENNNLSLSDLNDSAILRENESLLSLLFKDHTTGKNIKWGTDSYINHGFSFRNDQEIKINLITGWYEGFIRPRVDKDIDIQLERQRNRAEVFTPSWVIKLQVDAALEDMEKLPLADFIQTKWLEITCGEAPYMVNRFDMETGEVIPLKERSGFIDVKFKRLNKEVKYEEAWLKLALEIFKASYGYEYQGDSLLLARENLILTFIDNYFYMFGAFPKEKLLLEITKIISLNVFQMDGLTHEVPYSDGGAQNYGTQLNLFEEVEEERATPRLAKIKFEEKNNLIEFKSLIERKESHMKFDVIIGNPPYQESVGHSGGNRSKAKAIYHHFIREAIRLNPEKVVMITPSRWMTKSTEGIPSDWVENMLDTNMKVIHDYEDSSSVFPGVEIKGGVNYFLWESNYDGPTHYNNYSAKDGKKIKRVGKLDPYNIGILIRDPRAFSIVENIIEVEGSYYDEDNFSALVSPKDFFTNKSSLTSSWKDYKIHSSKEFNIRYYLNQNIHKREYGWININQIPKNHQSIDINKVYIPAAGGTGSDKKVLGNPFIGESGTVCSQTYLVIGYDPLNHNFTKEECENITSYIHTKFFRYLVSIKKKTQNGARGVYELTPVK